MSQSEYVLSNGPTPGGSFAAREDLVISALRTIVDSDGIS